MCCRVGTSVSDEPTTSFRVDEAAVSSEMSFPVYELYEGFCSSGMLRGVGYRCFGDTCSSHIQGSSSPSQITGAEDWNLTNGNCFYRYICCVNWKTTARACLRHVWTQCVPVLHFLVPKRKVCRAIHSCTNLLSESVHTSTIGPLLYQKCEACPESIQPFWISREPVAWPWCNSAASQRRPYCVSVKSHPPVGLVGWQWDAVDWVRVLCDRHIHKSPHFQGRF